MLIQKKVCDPCVFKALSCSLFRQENSMFSYLYFIRRENGWKELPVKVQDHLYTCDVYAVDENAGPMTGIAFDIPGMPGARYVVRVCHDGTIHMRTVHYNSGLRTEIRYQAEVPDMLESDYFYPAQ